MKKRIYIAGPMTGIENFNYPAFHAAAKTLRDAGHDAVNPAEISPGTEKTWECAMRQDLREMLTCDAVALLPGWESSKGANIERELAGKVGIKVHTIDEVLSL